MDFFPYLSGAIQHHSPVPGAQKSVCYGGYLLIRLFKARPEGVNDAEIEYLTASR